MSTPHKNLITSALPYINGVKHLGNLIGSLLPADVYARYCRQQAAHTGAETLFICATDDHGTPAEIAAQKAKMPVQEFCAEQHEIQKSIYERFGLSFDHFGATSRTENREITQQIARALFKNGQFEVKSIKQIYSPTDGRFLPDRYVEGTCPHCGYTKARGDQCENCTRVLDPTDLIEPRSAISGSTDLEVRETKHAFLKLSNAAGKIRTWVESHPEWPATTKGIALKWLDEGLQDRGMTRDLKWGVPVPVDTFGADFAEKVFYVWFDAPIGYIGASAEWASREPARNWQDWWQPADAKAVTYTQFMAKDNIPFHAIIFPAMLMDGVEENARPWKQVDTIKGFNWLTYYGGKFSTSQGVGIFTDTALDLTKNIPNGPDYWRYYLLARAPETDDSSFTWTEFQAVVNKDLADVLGNFVNRTLQLSHRYFGEKIPPMGTPMPDDMALAERLNGILARYTNHFEKLELRKAVEALRELWVAGNEYLAAQEPWQKTKTDKERAGTILHLAIQLIPLYARAMAPVIPFSAAKIMALFENPQTFIKAATPQGPAVPAQLTEKTLHTPWPWPSSLATAQDVSDATFTLPSSVLFPKITDEQVAEWSAAYGQQKA